MRIDELEFEACHGGHGDVKDLYEQLVFNDYSDFEHLFQVVKEAHGDVVGQIQEMYDLHDSEVARELLEQMIQSMKEMPTKEFRNSCAEEDLLEFTLEQADFVLLMVSITAEKMRDELDNTGLDRIE